jgi:hypothetical protein
MRSVDNTLKGIRDALILSLCANVLPDRFWDGAEQFNNARVELGSRAAQDFIAGDFVRQCPAVATVGSDGVVTICNCEDAGAERDAFAGEAIRIASAVEAFVVMSNDGSSCAKELDRFDNAGADYGVSFHLLKFQNCQFGGFEENGVGNGDFADIMQQRSPLQHGKLRGRIVGKPGQVGSVGLYAHGVGASLAFTSIQGGNQRFQTGFVRFVKLAESNLEVARASADDIVEQFRVCTFLALEAEALVTVFYRTGNILDREWFQEKVGGSKTDAAQHVRKFGTASHKNYREVPTRFGRQFQQFRARHSRHVNVAKNNIEVVARDRTYAILHIRSEFKKRRVFVKRVNQEAPNLRLIIDHQDSRGRGEHAKPRLKFACVFWIGNIRRDLEVVSGL